MNQTRENLRKILGIEELIARLTPQPNRERIRGAQGIAWMNGYGADGKVPDEEEQRKADEENPGKKGSRELSGGSAKQAGEPLEKGDDVGDMEGLKDCSSGRCINMRLHGKALPPQGWPAPCQPPANPEAGFYFTVQASMHWIYPIREKIGEISRTKVRTRQQMIALVQGVFGENYSKAPDKHPHNANSEKENNTIQNIVEQAEYTNKSLQWRTSPPPGADPSFKYGVKSGFISFSRTLCSASSADKAFCAQSSAIYWPEDTCSELIAGNEGFQAACFQYDRHLPPQYAQPAETLELCDKDGNKVRFSKNADGNYEIYQEKYRKTAVVDPATFKVIGFK